MGARASMPPENEGKQKPEGGGIFKNPLPTINRTRMLSIPASIFLPRFYAFFFVKAYIRRFVVSQMKQRACMHYSFVSFFSIHHRETPLTSRKSFDDAFSSRFCDFVIHSSYLSGVNFIFSTIFSRPIELMKFQNNVVVAIERLVKSDSKGMDTKFSKLNFSTLVV